MRSTDEWIGATDDAAIPRRVRLRVFERHNGMCHLAKRKIAAGEPWEIDHIVALVNGGSHRESNLAPVLKDKHREKTKQDVAEKSKINRKRGKHLGVRKRSTFACSRDSRFKKKIDGRVVLR